MIDKDISFSCVIAWAMTAATVLLLMCASGMWMSDHDAAAPLGWSAVALSVASGVTHIRAYFVAQNKLIRLLMAGSSPRAPAELHPIR